ncbi:MAG: ArnT family glycosyltransferase [Blastocatellia bacterium]
MKAPHHPSAPPARETNSLDEPSATAKQRLWRLLVLVATAFVTFFFGLGRLALLGPDEPRYAEIAREMFASGDWISPRLCGCLWFEKPALVYWMSALGYRVFGVNEFAARLPVALAATLTALLLYFVIRRLASPRMAWMTALVLLTSVMFIGYARVAAPDMPLAATMALALLSGFLATQVSGRRRTLLWMVSFAAMGLAMLAKGLAGVVLVALILAFYFMWMRRTRFINWREMVIGTIIFLIVTATWYVPVTMRHGWPFIYEFFIRHHFERFTSNEFGHPQPFYFFLPIAFAGIAPWSAFLLPAIVRLRRLQPRDNRRDALVAFAWVWAAVIVIFFSFSGSKLPGYILPAFPALAIIVGDQMDRFVSGQRSRLMYVAVWMTAIFTVAIVAGFVVYVHREEIPVEGWRALAYVVPAAIALAAVALLAARRRGAFVLAASGVIMSVVVCAGIALMPKLNDELTRKPLALAAASSLRPGERIAFYILLKEYAPVFYSQGRVACGIGDTDVFNALSSDELAAALHNEPSFVVITLERWRGGLEQDERFTTEPLAQQGDAVALRVSLK